MDRYAADALNSIPAPVDTAERVAALDVLRGIALSGVFLMNFTGFAGENVMATESQLLSLPTAGLDAAVAGILAWLVADKANTLFAFLFGIGFYLQMARLDARGAESERIYRRRLTVLLFIGIAHQCLLWNWDILHLYALAGFLLLAFRSLGNRTLVIAGLLLAAFGRTAIKTLSEFASPMLADLSSGYTEAEVLDRQGLSNAGDYFGLVRNFLDETMIDYVLSGFLLGWLAYALGRFLLGAWVGRRAWIERPAECAAGWRRVLRVALPAGLALEGAAVLLAGDSWGSEFEHRDLAASTLHLLAVPVLAAGYVAAIVRGLQGGAARVLGWFAPAGRMALTNYLAQSFIYAFVLFGVGPGLALAGRIGTAAITLIVMGVYALQVIGSHWWLRRFRYGPVEWLWRALTYGHRPAMRL